MHLQPLRRASALVTAGVAAAILSACGGHSSNPVVPGATNAPSPKTVTHKTIVITKASIPSVMAKLIRASAFASPMKGHPRQPQSLRRALTSSAGMDLSYNGGPVQTGASEYNVLVNCNDESCWGGLIGQFENDLFSSNMIHIVDQYNAGGTYGNGGDYGAQYDTS